MSTPKLFTPVQIYHAVQDNPRAQVSPGRWVPMRGVRLFEWKLGLRIKLAFLVFIGKIDAVKWEA